MSKKFEKSEKIVVGKDKEGKDIIKTKYTYKKILIALNPEEHKLWKENYKNKGFDSLTAMIRTAVGLLFDEIPNPEEFKPKNNINSEKLENEVSDLKTLISDMRKEQRKSNQEFLALNRQMLKFLANGKANTETTKNVTIQEKIFDLIKKEPNTAINIANILGIDEHSVFHRLNMLKRKDLIFYNNKNAEWSVI